MTIRRRPKNGAEWGVAAGAAVVLARFDLGAGDNWRLGHLYYYDANDFATFVITGLPFGRQATLYWRRKAPCRCADAGPRGPIGYSPVLIITCLTSV